ncbi:Stf0 family sulfotransferase [Mycobacterium parmense]|uniref:Uncharacterized protein n=1 Tax=Mycobacterium parmense TaxID=185642 RepID=A0A7I7YZP6_9MYCO|nr:Stf0 family sulfotransferase [Mycobacterium parmense]MCV7350004.1 hypothetical protein [Mycobacterium parmense]ORW59284.1 hypothetical protein AWC20_10075 [Mycobacterium parmense]BBZ46464.1 hypothetical protein MPRM_37450 [Mycobacterium parmense]
MAGGGAEYLERVRRPNAAGCVEDERALEATAPLGTAGGAVSASKATECTYVIATSPRSGSNLLCEALAHTGIAGRPAEIGLKFRGDVPFDEYVPARIREFATDNGVCGVKLFWGHLQVLVRAGCASGDSDQVLEHFFPGAHYIRLIRPDRRGQAISLYRALATNEFRRRRGVVNPNAAGPDPEFDGEGIRRLERMLDRHEASWDQSFHRRGITPLLVDYDSLVEHRCDQVARVLGFIGQDPAAAATIPASLLVRQADAKTVKWRKMLDAEDALVGAD